MPELEEHIRVVKERDTAMRELDKVTEKLIKTQDELKEVQDQLAEKKHSEQLGAWAIDRAIELYKLRRDADTTLADLSPDNVLATALQFTTWIKDTSAKEGK